MDDFPDTPPQSGLYTPNLPPVNDATNDYATPTSLRSIPSQQIPRRPIILRDLSQHDVDADSQLRRFQQDLLILTSFNESDTLHWRPLWFRQDPFSAEFWSLYNPPNVVTELLPRRPRTRLVYTRRMRRDGDPPPMYIKTWKHWYNVCDQRGVPHDFLCVDQVELMRLGLPRDENDNICGKSLHSFPNLGHCLTPTAPPSYPLYPEPQPLSRGSYILTPSSYPNLPSKFHNLRTSAPAHEDDQVVIVRSDGRLAIELRENYFQHSSQWTHFDGKGQYTDDRIYVPHMNAPKDQVRGRRWSYLPWTRDMEESCKQKLYIRLKGWNSTMVEEEKEKEKGGRGKGGGKSEGKGRGEDK
jgi:hypothetical protein